MKEPKVENYLKRGQYKFDHKTIPLADIDMTASKENPARLTTAVDADRVTKYGCEMIDGVEFPAIVVLNQPSDHPFKWIIGTGVHRTCAAIEAGKTTIEAYCVFEPDDYRRDLLFKQLNTLEGIGVSIPEQVRLVIDIHMKRNIPLKQLAAEWDLRLSQLQNALLDYRARHRGEEHGWDFKKQKVPQKTYLALNRISSNVTYEAAAKCAVFQKLPPSVVEEMVGEVVKTKSEADAAERIHTYRDIAMREAAKSKAVIARLPTARANKMLSDAKAFARSLDDGIEKLFLSSLPDIPRAIDIVQRVIDRAQDIKLELEHIQRSEPGSSKAA
jgi:hypothetical protein